MEERPRSDVSDGYSWWCRQCKGRKTTREGSFFSKSKLSLQNWLFLLVLKGIIGYSDYSLEMEIFECFQANRIFVCYFKASHLCTLAVC